MNKRIVKIPRISMCGILQVFRSLLCFTIGEKCYTNGQFSCAQSVSTTGWESLKRIVLMSQRKKDDCQLPAFGSCGLVSASPNMAALPQVFIKSENTEGM